MLCNNDNPKISAFDNAQNVVKNLSISDIVFYYSEGKIIAVGEVISDCFVNKVVSEAYRKVELIVKPKQNNNKYIGIKVDKKFRRLVKKDSTEKGFFLSRTDKRPYLYDEEIDEAIKLIKNTIN